MRYEEYKDFDGTWLKQLPFHWKTRKIKYQFDEISDKGHPDGVPLVASQHMGVVPKDIYGQRTVVANKGLELFKKVEIGDFVISLRSFQGGLEYAYYEGIISPAYTILRNKNAEFSGYYRYLFKSAPFIKLLTLCVTGIREGQNIDYQTLKQYSVPVPPRDEQDQIVRYLDWKVSCINKLIHGYQRQIKLLEERRQTIINDAIVHGISEAPRHRVKAAWMDNVPHNWSEMRMKNFFTEINERSVDGHEPHLSMSQKKGLVTDDENIERRLLSESYAGGKLCQKDDLVLNRLKTHLGVFALAPQLGVISPDYTVLRLNTSRVRPLYAEYLLKSIACRRELRIRVRGIVEGFWRLYTEDLGSIYVCLPPLEEQDQILEYVQGQEQKYKFAIERIEKQIALLKEYRTRMISDVVTGQMDVRSIFIPDYTPEDDTVENEADEETTDEEVSMDAD